MEPELKDGEAVRLLLDGGAVDVHKGSIVFRNKSFSGFPK
jgi:hypothetical protein